MKVKRYVLDTSALLTYFNAEDGIEVIDDLFSKPQKRLLISFLTLFELHYLTQRTRSRAMADAILRATLQLEVEIDYSNGLAEISAAGVIKGNYQLSAVDAWIAALAHKHQAVLVHKDPEFDNLEGQVKLLSLPYAPG